MSDQTEPATTRSAAQMATDRHMYLLSNVIDTVRGTALQLLSLPDVPASLDATTSALISRYNNLLADITAAVEPADRETFEQWAPTLGTEAALVEVYDAATTLDRLVDVHVQVDAFVAQRVQQRLDINSSLGQAPKAYPDLDTDDPTTAPGLSFGLTPRSGQGQYL